MHGIFGSNKEKHSVEDTQPVSGRLDTKEGIIGTENGDLTAALVPYAEILDASPLPTVVLDQSGSIQLWNRAAERVLGWTADEVLGHQTPSVPMGKHDAFEQQFQQALRGEIVTGVESQRRTKEGKLLEVRLAAAPLRNQHGQIIGVVRTFEDVTDRVRAEQERRDLLARERQVRQEAQRVAAELAAILTQMADGVTIVDADGRITFCNDAAQRMGGNLLVPGTSLGSAIDSARVTTVEGEPYPLDEAPLVRALRDHATIVDARWRIPGEDAADTILQGSATPLLGEDGRLLGAVSVFRDVTMERTLEQQKDEFLSTAAHDLRTPLTALKGYTDLLRHRIEQGRITEPEQILEILGRIERNTTRMTKLVNELLDMTRLQMRQTLDLNYQPVDLVALLSRCVNEQREATDGRYIAIDAQLSQLVGRWDANRLERMISNLLSNAIKYSPDDSTISVTVTAQSDGAEDYALVTIQDRGIGIPADDLPHIFERFHRGHNVGRETMGTGIGLAGVRQIVEQHGGTIEVESKEGEGTTFTIRLPLLPPGVRAPESAHR